MRWIACEAERQRKDRHPVPSDNPFLQVQETVSSAIEASLDQWRIWRDNIYEQTFNVVYGSPWVQAWAGLNASDTREPLQHPGVSPVYKAYIAAETQHLRGEIPNGGLIEAGKRAVYYIASLRGSIDERSFNLVRQLCQHCPGLSDMSPAEVKRTIRKQANLMRLDPEGTIAALPLLLSRADVEGIEMWADAIDRL
jgi:hypothetical protein